MRSILLLLDISETFQELKQQQSQQEAKLLLVHPARLLSALHGKPAFLVLGGGEGLSVQDRVNCTEKKPCCIAQPG